MDVPLFETGIDSEMATHSPGIPGTTPNYKPL